jgi:hypothetical protein
MDEKMEITMKTTDLKTAFDACKNFVSKKDRNPALKTVQLNFFNGTCTAYALDGIKLMTVAVPYVNGDEGTICVPIVKLPRDKFVRISDEGDEITFDFLGGKCRRILKKYEGNFPNDPEHFLKQEPPTLRIGFDPRNLRDALDGFKNETFVVLNFVDNRSGCVIEGKSQKAVVLPRVFDER